MAISYEQSKRNYLTANTLPATASIEPAAAMAPIEPVSMADPVVMTMSAPSDDYGVSVAADSIWTTHSSYKQYTKYSDDKMSYIDGDKNVSIDKSQINLTQETNSQYIPFEMSRYYDGIDLTEMMLMIHFVNKDGGEGRHTPVNVKYNDSKIRFAWLVEGDATAVAGKVQLEIEAIGVNELGEEYKWVTRHNGFINIEESLSGNGMIEPSTDWTNSFITTMNMKIAEAASHVSNAQNASVVAQSYAQDATDAANQAQAVVDNAKTDILNTVDEKIAAESLVNDEKIATALENYDTSAEVDQKIAAIDLSDQLTDVNTRIDEIDSLSKLQVELDSTTNTVKFYNGEVSENNLLDSVAIPRDPSVEWTTAHNLTVESKIADAVKVAQDDLDAYKEATNADLEQIHSDIDGLPETLESDYYNKATTDELLSAKVDSSAFNTMGARVTAVESGVTVNKDSLTTVTAKLGELEEAIGAIDTSPALSYDATYNEDGQYEFKLWETEAGVRSVKSQFVIQGGSGGGGTSSVLKIEYVTKTPIVATLNDTVEIKYNFSGKDSSDDDVLEGTYTWKIGNTVIASGTATAGENTFDATQFIGLGTQKLVLSITDEAGSLVTKSWTVQQIDVRLESTFNDKLTYPIGAISFDYTPYGAIEKTVHFKLDGEELTPVTTSTSGIPMAYTLPSQPHGAHLLETWITASINNSTVESNHIVKDIIWYDATSDVPVIGCVQQNFTARQYDTTNITYTVYDPKTESPEVTLAVDGVVVSTISMDSNTQVWQFKSSDVGDHVLTVTCRDTVKTLNVTVTKLDINIEPVTAGLVFDFNPVGRSNNDANRLWSDGDVAMTVSENFDWVNGGYQMDENGDQYFCVKAGTTADINYKLFADDAKKNGKEFKIIFKTTNVSKPNTRFLHCIDSTTGDNHIGVEMFTQEAYIYGQSGKLQLSYSEEDVIEFEFNISKDTESIPMVIGYEDGVSTRPMVYDDSHNFTQDTPKIISLGSDECDLHIYRFKTYNTSLTARGILSNFIADARTAEEMINRYERNQIYDENGLLNPDVLAEKCPWLRVYKLSAPYFTNNKSDKVPNSTIQQIYKNGDIVLDNWTCYNAQHSGQGTSSNNYGAAGRNLDFIMNKSGIDGVKPYFKLGDGSEVEEITLTRTSVPIAYLNAKVKYLPLCVVIHIE